MYSVGCEKHKIRNDNFHGVQIYAKSFSDVQTIRFTRNHLSGYINIKVIDHTMAGLCKEIDRHFGIKSGNTLVIIDGKRYPWFFSSIIATMSISNVVYTTKEYFTVLRNHIYHKKLPFPICDMVLEYLGDNYCFEFHLDTV
jgi:hypothetical protein